MNLRKFSCLVRQTARLFYTNPLVHLIIDFVIKHKFVESYTFTFKHKLENIRKEVQAALQVLKKHEILNQIDMKRDHFIKEYVCSPSGLGMKEDDYKNKHKADVYYFNVDLKFIIKARLQRVRKEFEEHVKGNLKHG